MARWSSPSTEPPGRVLSALRQRDPARLANKRAAAFLRHPRIRQPDGTRIHDRLTRGRRQGEIVPLSTLTHALGGGAGWPEVGD
ncbi:hypothetical protein AB0D27_42635 [Streptomyces sp. NPDC048415]|uniref:hypothetical protein n=1 Tax=Streptomyces sp. NPDC048415 TaxID=3154822 RepID=UPI00342C4487